MPIIEEYIKVFYKNMLCMDIYWLSQQLALGFYL